MILQWLRRVFTPTCPCKEGPIVLGTPRSKDWSRVRDQFLHNHPICAVCHRSTYLNVHHKKPYHLYPALELDPNNLVTLCNPEGHGGCHLLFGHLMSWEAWNPQVDADISTWQEKISARIYQRVD